MGQLRLVALGGSRCDSLQVWGRCRLPSALVEGGLPEVLGTGSRRARVLLRAEETAARQRLPILLKCRGQFGDSRSCLEELIYACSVCVYAVRRAHVARAIARGRRRRGDARGGAGAVDIGQLSRGALLFWEVTDVYGAELLGRGRLRGVLVVVV